MSSILKILRRIGGAKVTPTAGEEGQLAIWKADKTATGSTSLFFHDGNQWVELIDTAMTALRNVVNTFTASQVIDVTDTNPALRITQKGTGAALLVEDEANPDASPFVVDTNGNVGVGTATILAKLHVEAGGVSCAEIFGSTHANGVYARFQNGVTPIGDIGSGASIMSGGLGKAGDFGISSRSGNLILGQNTNERMKIDTHGRITVNKIAAEGSYVCIPADGTFSAIATIAQTTGTQIHIDFRNNGGRVGAISTNGSTVTYATGSDYRLKEDARPVADAAARLGKLKPVNFAWKVDGSRVDGFLAHEVQAVVPEAVTGTKDAVGADGKPEYQGIDQSKLVPLLVAALQDALKRIEVLEARP